MENQSYTYEDSGYNKFLTRSKRINLQKTEYEVSHEIQQITGSSIASGISTSPDGKLTVNWDQRSVIASDGAHNRVVIGKIPEAEDSYGIKIYDEEGNLVFDVTSGTANIANAINVGDGNMIIDGTNRRIVIYDETGLARVLLGYQPGGF